ncbi:hypothetical protein AHF37_02518 [Paragonimus kellicotti]|nr:hypothetical protein AHF37_02518 [Paragonimus kellicotti]
MNQVGSATVKDIEKHHQQVQRQTLIACRQNPVAKAFYYCHRAAEEENMEQVKSLLKFNEEAETEGRIEHKQLSELSVELIWAERELAYKLDKIGLIIWMNQVGSATVKDIEKHHQQVQRQTLIACRQNPVAKAFYYCHRAAEEENMEQVKSLLKNAEQQLHVKTFIESPPSNLPGELSDRNGPSLTSTDRPPAPVLISQDRTSMTFRTEHWKPTTECPVAYYALYGHVVTGANKTVHNVDNKLSGTASMTPVTSGQCVLRAYGLMPDADYVFAVAAYDEDGQPLGTHQCGLGHSTPPILVCPPLSSLVALSYLAQILRIDLSQRLLIGMEIAELADEGELVVNHATLIYQMLLPLCNGQLKIPIMAKTAYKRALPRIGSKCVQILWNKFVIETLPEQPYTGPDSSPVKGFKTYRSILISDCARLILVRCLTLLLSAKKHQKRFEQAQGLVNWPPTNVLVSIAYQSAQVLQHFEEHKAAIHLLKMTKKVFENNIQGESQLDYIFAIRYWFWPKVE